MYEIKKIKMWPFARSFAVIVTAAMVIIPLGIVFFIAVMESRYRGFDLEIFFDILLEEDFLIGYFILIPISAAVSLGAGSLGALAYNFISDRLGGIILEIDYHQGNSTVNQQNSNIVNQENK